MAQNRIPGKLPGVPTRSAPMQRVAASIYHAQTFEIYEVTAPDDRTLPILRKSTDRVSFYLTGSRGDKFRLEVCFQPVYTDAAEGALDPGASLWVAVGADVSIPNAANQPTTLRQSLQDHCFAYRLIRVSGTGAFTVRSWWLA